MIVISHPWEFVPKGNSHFNYHTGSSNNKKSDSKNASSTTSGNLLEMQQNQQQQQSLHGQTNSQQQHHQQLNSQQFYLQKSHLNRVFSNHNSNNMRKNPAMIISEDGNSSINELSYGYMPKTPFINNINFETASVKHSKNSKNINFIID